MSEELETQGPRKLSMAALSGTLDGANYSLQALRDKCIKLAQQHQDRRFWIHQINTDMNALQEKLTAIREHLDAETATALRLELAQAVAPIIADSGDNVQEMATDIANLIAQLESQGYVVLTSGEKDEQSSASKDEAKKEEEDSAADASTLSPVGTATGEEGSGNGSSSDSGSTVESSAAAGSKQTTTTTTNDGGAADGNGSGTTTNSTDTGTTSGSGETGGTDNLSGENSSTSTLPLSGTVGLSTTGAKPKATLGNRVLGK